MASSLMHLAIAKMTEKQRLIKNLNRYHIGQILPDVVTNQASNHNDRHFKLTVCDGSKKMIDFTGFRNLYREHIVSDSLYLGYYLHLVQDAIYRKFLYVDFGYTVACQKDVEALYHDFQILNSYLVSTYHLEDNLVIPDDYNYHEINEIDPSKLNESLLRIHNEMNSSLSDQTIYFTKKMSDEYITKAVDLCCKEYDAVLNGKEFLNPYDFAWDLPYRK